MLTYFNLSCRPLYGSAVRVDNDGTIFFPSWHQVREGEHSPETYTMLSRVRLSDEAYLLLPLVTKEPYELRINQVRKANGAIEVGIRMTDHVIAEQINREQPQMRMVRERVGEMLDVFGDYAHVSDEQFQEAAQTTLLRLAQVRFDPQAVLLREKQHIAVWLPKGSSGIDSLGRRNYLISVMALQAAHRKAVLREQGLGVTINKYAQMREALLFEREFCRSIFTEVAREIGPDHMQSYTVFRFPERPAVPPDIVSRMIRHKRWQLNQTHAKPYRPVGTAAGGILEEAADLVARNDHIQAGERLNLARTVLGYTLAWGDAVQDRDLDPVMIVS